MYNFLTIPAPCQIDKVCCESKSSFKPVGIQTDLSMILAQARIKSMTDFGFKRRYIYCGKHGVHSSPKWSLVDKEYQRADDSNQVFNKKRESTDKKKFVKFLDEVSAGLYPPNASTDFKTECPSVRKIGKTDRIIASFER